MRHRQSILLISAGLVVALLCTVTPSAAQPDAVGQWTVITPLPYFPVHTHMLPTGQVLIWPGDGGVSGNDPRSWDPATQSVTAVSKPGYDTFCSGHAFLADGSLFVAGGHIQNGVGLSRASTYNPFSNTWSPLPDMNAGRWYPTTTTLADGDVLVVSGEVDQTTGVNTLPQVFQVGTGTWRSLTNAQLGMDLYPHMLLAPNGKLFNPGPSATTRELDTTGSGAWSFVATRVGGYRGYGSAVMYAPGKVLVMGGGDPPTSSAEVIDLNQASPAWRAVSSMQFARRQINAVLLPDGKVLVTGGTSGPGFNDATAPVFAAELWDPGTETWSLMASASVPRLYHSAALLLPDGRVLSTGGNGYAATEIYSPPYLFKGPRPVITETPASTAYGQSFFVQTPDAASVRRVTILRLSSVTHAFNQNQRINELSFSSITGGLSVTAPGSGTAAPPGHYMLFILDGNDVPSVARIIQLGGTAPPPPPPPPAPTITALSPSSAAAGGPSFTLTVTGTNFVSGSVVRWKGEGRPTTFVSTTQLTAAIAAADIASPGTAQVTVANPDGAVSGALPFTITSPPPPSSFTLTVSKKGPGSVASSPSGITCGSDCSQTYGAGTSVILTPTPNKNARFAGWSGACSGTGTCSVTMNAAKSVSATFAAK